MLEALIESHPNLDRAEYSLGNAYCTEGHLLEAERHYRRAVQLNPLNSSYYAALGSVLRKQPVGEDEAVTCLRKALSLNPRNVQAEFDLALSYNTKRNYLEAQSLLEDAVRKRPDWIEAHRILARIYYRLGRKVQAEREIHLAAQLEDAESQPAASRPDPLSLESPPDD